MVERLVRTAAVAYCLCSYPRSTWGACMCSSKGASCGKDSRTNHIVDGLTAGLAVMRSMLGNGEVAAGIFEHLMMLLLRTARRA